jgi:ribulose-phosphate 3-epimerase
MAEDERKELPGDRRIAPSILSADFSRLGELVAEIMDAGAHVIHVDVMDGHFVPPITIGPLVVEALNEQVHDAGGWLDVHLMIERPQDQVLEFAKAGADSITVHFEATPHVNFTLQSIRDEGCAAGIALCPSTPAEAVRDCLDATDLVLCMTVNPGWGGQKFIPAMLDKLARLREMLPDQVRLEVDGGIDASTVGECADNGATLFVAGSKVFGADDPVAAYREIAEAAGAA